MDDLIRTLTGFFVRFGFPIGLTTFLVWLLKRLDCQWLEESRTLHNRTDLRQSRLHWLSRSWIRPMEGCRFFEQWVDPCWEMRVAVEGDLPEACLRCVVYQVQVHQQAA